MVTVIITAYNVSGTIREAVQSCIDQTYKDLEILVINDCSTDNTLEVLETFGDTRIRIINNSENLGAGLSRRIGTKEAKGEYTTFLDGDDTIDSDYIETLYNIAKRYNADVVGSGLRVLDNGKVTQDTYDEERIMRGIDLYRLIPTSQQHRINLYLNTKLVARWIWDKVDYSDRRFVEDSQSNFYVLFYANRLVVTPYVGYNYIQRSNSLVHSANMLKFKIYRALCAKDICEFCISHLPNRTDEAKQAFLMRFQELATSNINEEDKCQFSLELAELCVFLLQRYALPKEVQEKVYKARS